MSLFGRTSAVPPFLAVALAMRVALNYAQILWSYFCSSVALDYHQGISRVLMDMGISHEEKLVHNMTSAIVLHPRIVLLPGASDPRASNVLYALSEQPSDTVNELPRPSSQPFSCMQLRALSGHETGAASGET
jgi:hypothetical protein